MTQKNLNGAANAQVNGVKNAENAEVMQNTTSLANLQSKLSKEELAALKEQIAQEARANELALAEKQRKEKAEKAAHSKSNKICNDILRMYKADATDIRTHIKGVKKSAKKLDKVQAEMIEKKFSALESECRKAFDYVIVKRTRTDENGNKVTEESVEMCIWQTKLESADNKRVKIKPIANMVAYKYHSEAEVSCTSFADAHIKVSYEAPSEETKTIKGKKYRLDEKVTKSKVVYPCITEHISLAEFSRRFRKAWDIVFPDGIK